MTEQSPLPPSVDLTERFRRWEECDVHLESMIQDPVLQLVRTHGMSAFARDKKANEGTKMYLCRGLRIFWPAYQRTLIDADLAMGKLRTLRAIKEPLSKQQRRKQEIFEAFVNRADYYELTTENDPMHLMFDIEYYHERNAQRHRWLGRHWSPDELLELVLQLVQQLFHEYFGMPDMRKRWQEVWLDSTNDEKVSRHLMLRLPDNMMFTNFRHCGAFERRLTLLAVREYGEPHCNPFFVEVLKHAQEPESTAELNDRLDPFIDPTTKTKNRAMRLVGSSKKGNFRTFVPMTRIAPTAGDGSGPLIQPPLLPPEHPAWLRRTSPQDVTYEWFKHSLLHSPPEDRAHVRLLSVTEADNKPPVSRSTAMTHVGRRYRVLPDMVGIGGSLLRGIYGDALPRFSTLVASTSRGSDTNATATHAAVSDTDTRIRITQHEVRAGAPPGVDPETFHLCVDIGNALADALHDKVRYYWLFRGEEWHRMDFQIGHLCPMIGGEHNSNYVVYMMDLQPRHVPAGCCIEDDGTPVPLVRVRCFKCGTQQVRDSVSVAFWNATWHARLVKYIERQRLSRLVPVYELLANIMW